MPYYLYILECTNNSFYIGYTTDIVRRYQEHCKGSAKCKYTRSFPPKRLVIYWEIMAEKSGEVLQLERRLKQLNKAQKETLIQQPEQITQYLNAHAQTPKAYRELPASC